MGEREEHVFKRWGREVSEGRVARQGLWFAAVWDFGAAVAVAVAGHSFLGSVLAGSVNFRFPSELSIVA